MSFNSKVVFITGAGSGIGKATALHFAKQSATLSLVDINKETLNITAEKCGEYGSKVLKVVADLTKDIEVKKVVDETVGELGKIDVVVNCVGIHGPGSIMDVNLMEKFDGVMAVNLRSAVVLTSFAAPELIKTKGCVVNISSVAAKLVTPGYFVYNVSKAGLSHFMRSVALELAPKGVRVVNVLPAGVKTNILRHSGVSPEDDEKAWDMVSKSLPLKHLTEGKDVAELIGFLASDKARSITGSDFAIDAGMLLASRRKPPEHQE